jgi:hypothetical protein
MKNQLLKLALLGLFGTFGYSDGDFDIDKDGKVDKIGGDFLVFSNIHWVIPKEKIILDLKLAIEEYNKK